MINELAAAVQVKRALINPETTLQNKENITITNQAQPFFSVRNQAAQKPVFQTLPQPVAAVDTLNDRILPQQYAQPMSFIDKKMAKNEKLAQIWLKIAKYALEQDYQRAYEMALVQVDDIYLLRLIVQTGPVISRGLTDSTGKQVLSRLNKIVRGGVFYKLQLEWLDDSKKTDLFRSLSQGEQNEYLDTLY